MKLKLHHVRNVDLNDDRNGYWSRPIDPKSVTVEVASLEEASKRLVAWVEYNGLGSGNMASDCGDVTDGAKLVAHVSYNGRVWEPGNYPTKEIRIGNRPLASEQFAALRVAGGAS